MKPLTVSECIPKRFAKGSAESSLLPVGQLAIEANITARQALAIMKKAHVDSLPVIDTGRHRVGVVKQAQLWQALYQRERSIRQAKEQKCRVVDIDHLTGLPNLTQLRDKIKKVLSPSQTPSQGAVLLIGLDNFRDVNNMMGSHFGDLILQQVALRISIYLRKNDVLARKGGDEFVLVLTEIGSVNDVALIAKELLKVLACPFMVEGQEIYITASVGISFYPMGTPNPEVLLANADIALWQAKEIGRNNYQIFMQEMGDKVQMLQKLEKRLRQSLPRNELFMCYQPQVETKNNRIVGMEALLRWQSPELGLIFPNDFIPLAEKTGLIIPIGDWVLHTATAQIKQWQKIGGALRVAVNLSAPQLQGLHSQGGHHLIKIITAVLEETGLPPELLELEITESVIMKNYSAAMTTLKKLRQLGVRIACDDFGTGYSSLNYLKRFPIDTIKIDKSFIDDLAYDPADVAIIRAIILMAQQLKIEVVAEGVEQEEQLKILNELGCDIVQGFYFSKAVPPEEAVLLLQNGL